MGPQMCIAEVLAAIESLYADKLLPYGRILRKRLAERALDAGMGNVDINIKRVEEVCKTYPSLNVHGEQGGEFTVLFADKRKYPTSFVNIYSAEDTYPTE